MRKRVTTVRPPASGVVIRWGRSAPWDDPDLVVAWSPGATSAARVLLDLLDTAEARRRLEAAGVDRTSIRLTAQLKPNP